MNNFKLNWGFCQVSDQQMNEFHTTSRKVLHDFDIEVSYDVKI